MHGGQILEFPFSVPNDCIAGRFTANGRVLGVAAFANSEQMQIAFVALICLDRGGTSNSLRFEQI